MPYKCDRECFNKNEDGWCKDEWCRNPVPTLPYGAVYKHTDYAEEVYDKYTDTAGNIHWTGTHSGKHIILVDPVKEGTVSTAIAEDMLQRKAMAGEEKTND